MLKFEVCQTERLGTQNDPTRLVPPSMLKQPEVPQSPIGIQKLSQTRQILATAADKVYLNNSLNCLITFRLNRINKCFNLNKPNEIPHLPDSQSASTSCASSSFIVPQRTSSGVCMN